MTDVSIERISEIHPHPDADRLEVAYILGWQTVIQKGVWKAGDECVYIRPDAAIKAQENDWAAGIRKYLGAEGRVRTANLRGQFSHGLIMKLDDLPIPDERLRELDKQGELADALGIAHYIAPPPQDINFLATGLPYGMNKSDEEDYHNLQEKDLHLGERALLTQKVDGTSAALYYNPSIDELAFCTRGNVLKPERDNLYTIAMRPYVEHVKFLGKHFGEPVALRGEVCGKGINSGKCNRDAEGEPRFILYAVHFPECPHPKMRFGRWRSGRHFLDMLATLEKNGYSRIPCVPLVCMNDTTKPVLTMRLLKTLEQAPAEAGEGIVINGETFSYKVKSNDYDVKNH